MISKLFTLISSLKKNREMAIVAVLTGFGVGYFAIELTDRLINQLGPNALAASMRKEFSAEVMEAEKRSKEYADIRYSGLKDSVDTIKTDVGFIKGYIINRGAPKLSVLPNRSNNNKN